MQKARCRVQCNVFHDSQSYKEKQGHANTPHSFHDLKIGISFRRPIPGLPDFCHFLRVVGNLIPPYLKHKGRPAKESASCGWQMAAQKECLFGASRQFLWKSKVWHYFDRQPSGLPGSWTLKMTTGNLICRSTDVAYQVPKCGEPGVAGTKGKADTVLKAHKIQWVDTTIARTFSGRAHRLPSFSFAPAVPGRMIPCSEKGRGHSG